MIRTLLLSLLLASPAAAQSMDVRGITDNVMREVCLPLIEDNSLWAAIGGAEGLGYSVVDAEPDSVMVGAANWQPEPRAVTFRRSQGGTVRISRYYDRLMCVIGLDEGGADRAADAAAPHLRALGLSPVLEEAGAEPELVVWRGEGRLMVIAPSPHHPPGVELILSVQAPLPDSGRR